MEKDVINDSFLWTDNSTLSKARMLLSFQTVQKIHKGATFQGLLQPLPKKNLCHPRSVSLTEEGRAQDTPKRVNNSFQRLLVFAQWRRMWSIVSSLEWQRKHLFAKENPLIWTRSKVKVFPQVASQAKKSHLKWHTRTPNDALREQKKRITGLQSGIQGFDWKLSTLCNHSNHPIFRIPQHPFCLNK